MARCKAHLMPSSILKVIANGLVEVYELVESYCNLNAGILNY